PMKGRCSVLDFTGHFAWKGVCDYGAPMSSLVGNSYAARDPFHSVQFKDTVDTDNSPGEQIVNFGLMVNYGICTGEGVPMIYARDYLKMAICYGRKQYID